MLRFKKGVKIFGLKSEILYAIDCAESIWPKDLTVTSTRYTDSHNRASLHYAGHAVDLRTRNLSQEQIADIMVKLREILGNEFDVVHHAGSHLHIEYQPKEALDYPTVLIH